MFQLSELSGIEPDNVEYAKVSLIQEPPVSCSQSRSVYGLYHGIAEHSARRSAVSRDLLQVLARPVIITPVSVPAFLVVLSGERNVPIRNISIRSRQ